MKDMYLGILFVFIFPLQIIVTAQAPGCENCGCCVDKNCDNKDVQGYTVTDFCTNGCTTGIGGNRCYNKCPDDCVTCEQTVYTNCATCEVGKYLSTVQVNRKDTKRCVDCPANCTTCSSGTNCQECKEQYYNHDGITDCSMQCPSRCKTCTSALDCQECNHPYYNQGDKQDCSLSCPGNCVCSYPGVCSECQDSYFDVSGQCKNSCPVECRSCSDKNSCLVCKDGYFNGKESSTNREITDCSLQCRKTCVTCTAYDTCTHCHLGHYGSYCQNKCSDGCNNSVCDQNDGSCVCKDGFKGSSCTTCEAGRHGEQCEKQCPDTCKDNTCGRETGHCLGCRSGNIIGETCDRCANEFWGSDCSSACPQNCDGQCERNSGHCKLCKGNFQGTKCDDCISGFHGLECDRECPMQCYNSSCYRSNGTCNQCNNNYVGPTCEDCVAGMFGHNCDVPCPSIHCSNNKCDRNTGNCVTCSKGVYGLQCDLSCPLGCYDASCDFRSGACSMCREHYTGDKCCLEGGHCRFCSSETVCETCENGFFGVKCDKTCPTSCSVDGLELQCEKASGKCKQEKRTKKTNIAPVVGGGAAGIVVIIVIVILLIVVIRRRRSHANRREDNIEDKQTGCPQLPGPSPKLIDNKPIYSNDDLESAELEEDIIEDDSEDIGINIPEVREAVYENVTNATVSGLEAYVRKKTEEDYKHEFAQLPKGLTQSYNDARQPDNVVKNRYHGVYPWFPTEQYVHRVIGAYSKSDCGVPYILDNGMAYGL